MNYHEEADFLRSSELPNEEGELILLAKGYSRLYESIFIISDKYSKEQSFVEKVKEFGVFVKDLDGIYTYLLKKKEFIEDSGFYDIA